MQEPILKLTVRYFASVKEALGPSDEILISAGTTVGQVRSALALRSDLHARWLGSGTCLRAAFDHSMVPESTVICRLGELAFFPPVTGG